MKKLVLSILLMFLPMVTSAYDAKIDGIYYKFNTTDKTAEVTSEKGNSIFNSSSYSGTIIIPDEVTFNDTKYIVTSIADYAFYNCFRVTSVTIGKNISSIGDNIFESCGDLISISVAKENTVYDSRDNCNAIIETETNKLLAGCQSTFIPNSVTSIDNWAFYFCGGLTSITIPSNVTSIGSSAFFGSGIKKIIWLTNTPPDGYSYVTCAVNYVANNQYTSLSNVKVYPFLSSMFEVDGIIYVPVSPSERTCDAIDCRYDESCKNVKIDKQVVYKGVTMNVNSINPYICYNNNFIEQVELDNLSQIGDYAFHFCKSIKKINILNNGDIGTNAFSNCYALEEATISNNGDIGTNAFSNCSALEEATISNNGNIGSSAFSECSKLQRITISNKGNIGESVFYRCNSLKTASILNSGYIGDLAFSGCKALGSIALGDQVTTIREKAFQNCSALEAVIIPNAVTSIWEYAFSGCSSLRDVTLGTAVTSIGSYAFSDCSSLAALKLGDNVTSISEGAFSNCSTLYQLIIPQSVKTIQNNVFSGCTGLKNFIIENRESELSLGCNYVNSSCYPFFSDCHLDSVYIGGNITYKTSTNSGYSPFYRNTTLRTVVITDKETEISANEFYGCTNLQNFTVGNGVTTFGDWAFSGCSSLKKLTFGSQLKNIGKEAFSDCTSVESIISKATTPPACGTQALDDINKWSCTLNVPQGSLEAYQASDQWKEFFFVSEGEGGGGEPVTPETKKCEAPTISYANGQLTFGCATEGATFKYSINGIPSQSGEGSSTSMVTTFKVSVYASKVGYKDSETVTQDIDLKGCVKGDVNGDGVVDVKDYIGVANIIHYGSVNGK